MNTFRYKDVGLLLICFFIHILAQAKDYPITQFGAVGDGKTVNTQAIQKAIDACSATGGRVVIPKGTFLSGTIFLKNKTTLHLMPDAVLLGSGDFKDYPLLDIQYKTAFTHKADGSAKPNRALIFAEGQQNLAITGTGTLNGNGTDPAFKLGDDSTPESRARPLLIFLVNCKKIEVLDVRLRDSAYWLQNYQSCEDVHIRGINVLNHANFNTDGIDIDGKNFLVEDCVIDCDDDGICLKSHDRNRPCENVTVRNCTIGSNCNAIKFGTVGMGGFKNIDISNCRIQKASVDHFRFWQKNLPFIDEPITVISGLALELVDGGVMDNVTISDITMQDVQTPIFVVLGNRGYKFPGEKEAPVGQLKNVRIRNVTASGHSKMTSSITGFPGYYVQNVELSNITIQNMGSGTVEEATKPLPENPKTYPENRMYGTVYPAAGLFIRHVDGITLKNIKLTNRQPDARPSIVFDDVKNGTVMDLKTDAPVGGQPVVRAVNSRQIRLRQPAVTGTYQTLLDADSATNNGVVIEPTASSGK